MNYDHIALAEIERDIRDAVAERDQLQCEFIAYASRMLTAINERNDFIQKLQKLEIMLQPRNSKAD